MKTANALGLTERNIVGGGGDDLHAGDEIDEFGEIGQHHDRIGAGVILVAELAKGAGDVAARQRFEQIDHPGAVGKPQHLPHGVGTDKACRMRDRLIERSMETKRSYYRSDAKRVYYLSMEFLIGRMLDNNVTNLLLEQDLHIHPLLKAHPLQKVEILQGIEEGPPGFKF